MLILMENFFFGPILEELGECKSLTKIRIMKNQLNGTIPAGIFNLPLVAQIEVNENHFSGELSFELSAGELGILTLSGNQITGKIPPGIRNFKNLQTLLLEMNSFTGEIPEEIFHLLALEDQHERQQSQRRNSGFNSSCTSLTSADFSRNNLFGEIRKGISKLKDLSILNFSRNQLTGQIPSEIKFMTSLTTLDLSENNLRGTIPTVGQFLVFNDSSFAGNPNLCPPHPATCPSFVGTSGQVLGRSRSRSNSGAWKVVMAVIAIVTALSLVLVTVYLKRKKKLQKSRAWKLTAFQRLDFKAEYVLECLKEENIIGKGGAGILPLHPGYFGRNK